MSSPQRVRYSYSQVEKLRGSENYEDWVFEMEAVLDEEDLLGSIREINGAAVVTNAKKI